MISYIDAFKDQFGARGHLPSPKKADRGFITSRGTPSFEFVTSGVAVCTTAQPARRAGLPQPDRAELVEWIRGIEADVVLVEGASGLLVRLADDLTLADIASDLGTPLIIVTSMGLGSLNAAELTVEAAHHRGLKVLGLIGGSLPTEPDLATRLNVEEMPQVTGVPLLICLPAGMGQLSREEFAVRTSTINADVMIPLS